VIGKLVWENIKHRPMRSLLSVLAIGVPVTMQLTLAGLSHGFLDDTRQRARGIGADVVVRPKGSSLITLSGAPMSEGYIDLLLKQPHVKLAMGAYNQSVQSVMLGATGVDIDVFNQMSGGFQFIEGAAIRKPNDVVVDRYFAGERHLHAGDTVTLFNQPWHVAGIFEGGKLSHIIVPLKSLQGLFENPRHVSQIYLKLDDPKYIPEVVAHLKELMDDDQIYSMQELSSLYNVSNIPGLSEFIGLVIGVGVVIGFAVVGLSMYMSVLQRTREIGILKSLGASKGFILGIVLSEALLVGFGGTVLGIVMNYGAYKLLHSLHPALLPIIPVPEWWLYAGAVTLASALLGALYPGLSASRQDPIEALSYE
jgi:putative ABC transport system permease protein